MSGPLTMSKLDLASACPGAWGYTWATSTSEAAEKGSVLHAYLRDLAVLGREAALERVPEEHRELCAGWDTNGLPTDPRRYAHEVAYVLDPIEGTAREVGRNIGRAYPGVQVGEVHGTADVVGLVGDDGVAVIDLKTGRGHVPPAASNFQLAGLALASTLTYGRTEADVALLHRREDDSGWTDSAHLDAFDLRDRLRQIRGIVNAVAKARATERPDVHEGTWCRYCPAIASCPAKGALVRTHLASWQTPELAAETWREGLTPSAAACAHVTLEALERMAELMRGALDDYARAHPFELADGRIYGPVSMTRESLDGTRLWQILRRDYGEERAWEAVEMKATKAELGRVLGKVAAEKGEKRTHLERRVIEELRLTGGVRSKTIESVGARRVKP